MYNESLKTRFIREYTEKYNTVTVCITIFNAMEKFESQWNSDLCTQSSETLQPAVDSIAGLRAKNSWTRLIILKDYVRWCIKNSVPNACDGMLKIKVIGLDKVKQQTVANPLHLQTYLNCIYESEAEETIDNIFRCFFWLAYSGVAEEDIIKIKSSDVDLQNMIIKYNGTELPIYREALPAFKNCITLSQFAYNNPGYQKIIYKNRAYGDILVRGLKGTPSIKVLRASISRSTKEKFDKGVTSLRLSYYRAWISGLFYRMHERERAGIPVDFSIAAEKFAEGRVYKLDSGRNTLEAKKRQLARDYLHDYERWKLAYSF